MPRFICQGTWTDGGGVVVNEGTVTVYLAGTTTAATIYALETGDAASDNTVESDAYGHFVFWVDDSDYSMGQKFKYVLSKTSYSPQTLDEIVLYPNIRAGQATLVSGTVAVTFDVAESDTSYYIALGIETDPTDNAADGIVGYASKATTGFTINCADDTSTSKVDWIIAR